MPRTFDHMRAVEQWFEELPEEWRPVAEAIRDLLLEASPLMTEEWKYKLPFYSHRRWMCYLSLQKQGLVLGFIEGRALQDPDGLFAPTDHKMIRHYPPPRDPQRLPVAALRRTIQEAIAVNEAIMLERRAKEGKGRARKRL